MKADICHINLAREYRGGERQTELLVQGLAKNGMRQLVLARRVEPLAQRLSGVHGVHVKPLCSNLLRAAFAMNGSALLHVHQGRTTASALLRHVIAKTPYIVTRRVTNSPGADPMTRQSYLKAARLIAISEAIAESLRRYEPNLTPEVIPSAQSQLPVDWDNVRDLRERYPEKFLVGHVGALDNKHKGQINLIRAARSLEKSHPDIHFLLVGTGYDERWLKEQAAGLRNITFTGFVENVGDYLSALDVFAYPSFYEGMGSVLLDAMQMGLPIVASDTGGIPEIVRCERHGLLVPVGDSEALRDAILRLHDDAPLCAAMAKANADRVKLYSVDIMVQRYMGVYSDLIA